jgi:hypothetical protein
MAAMLTSRRFCGPRSVSAAQRSTGNAVRVLYFPRGGWTAHPNVPASKGSCIAVRSKRAPPAPLNSAFKVRFCSWIQLIDAPAELVGIVFSWKWRAVSVSVK